MARYRKTARLVHTLGLDSIAHRLAGSLCEVATDRPVFHLTFDDGPHPEVTPRLLDLLESRQAPATFFVLTEAAAANPELAREILGRGHDIGLHSRTHPRLSTAPFSTLVDEIWKAHHELEALVERPISLFRPPYGAHGIRSTYMVKARGMETVLWSVDSEDWKGLPPDEALDAKKLRPGGILLLHDTPARGSVVADQDLGLIDKVELTGLYLDELSSLGLSPVSLGDLRSGGSPVLRAKVAK